ncbi:hypothetical protein IQ265_15915 [Nodosilinea sp. LEGE 06152]|uniref:hypothetical protein n=1 Tax=Nodosilinea sp. LEGE 06152 TaxID=2777966 RepID=UPI00188125C8|nr:hypothetical protein [Nodosilinea sp. LEGE 06152]MBE9158302.1 hypothetical protein [Nodosilinea sp. LEGE 06152]
MFFHIPPALPLSDVSSAAFVQFEMMITDSDDCTQGSRDCFPKDRVGVVSQPTMVPVPMQSRDIEAIVRPF